MKYLFMLLNLLYALLSAECNGAIVPKTIIIKMHQNSDSRYISLSYR